MLEGRGSGGTASVPLRSVAQLVEHRSPKPGVAGSSPATPASGQSGNPLISNDPQPPPVGGHLDLCPVRQYIAATRSRPVLNGYPARPDEIPEQASPFSGSSFKRGLGSFRLFG